LVDSGRGGLLIGEAAHRTTREPRKRRERLRGLIDEILLEPHGDHLGIVLKGNLARMLRPAHNNKRPSETAGLLEPIRLVAGACNRRYLQLWSGAA
jgi:hypothetical protein